MRAFEKLLTKSRGLLICGALGLCSTAAWAEEIQRLISSHRVLLSDVAPEVPQAVGGIDLGKAPPPGRSRYISYEEIQNRLQAAGVPASTLKLPKGVRVTSEARSFSSDELESLVHSAVIDSMPSGVRLSQIKVEQPRVLSPDVSAGAVHLPRFVMRPGKQEQIGTVEIMWGNELTMRLPVRMTVEVDEVTLSEVVKRGSHVTLFIKKGNVEISAMAETLSQGRVGEVVTVRVSVTKKVMSARLVGAERAELEI